jgi:alginate O-acetyltransferase complex protein AlgI
MLAASPGRLAAGALPRVLLILAGLALLHQVSRGPLAPALLCLVSALSWWLGSWLRRSPRGLAHVWAARGAVPLAFLALVLMNVFGLVGTLTGAQSSLLPGASNAWIALPFYLLSAAAFLCEMAQQRMAAPRPLDFGVYMCLPFKLLAGPLEPPRLLDQIRAWRWRISGVQCMAAWPWMVLGAFMKYVIANRLDPARHLVHVDPVRSFLTAFEFELKFYFDFAGYSFMAYGAALAIGLRITQNFNQPFFAANVVVFWRRWHMSLGRYLTRYVLEPNLSLWKGRQAKLVFASAIFLVSAMWHGGTLNYLLWGAFHGLVYFAYAQWIKRREVPPAVGAAAMLAFFVFGRMFAVDADGPRLLERIQAFFQPAAYVHGWQALLVDGGFFTPNEWRALAAAAVFLALEVWTWRRWPRPQGYHLLRRPAVAFAMLILFIVFGVDDGALLYARI